MRSFTRAIGLALRRCIPQGLRAWVPVSLKAQTRALLGLDPWPDLAIRHSLFTTPQYRAVRQAAGPFDRYRKPYKPVIERGHQVSYLIGNWFVQSGVQSVFHAGYSNGRYLFYFRRMGLECGGTELPLAEAPSTEVPGEIFDSETLGRMLRIDFFELTPAHIERIGWTPERFPAAVLFTEATFETLIPWRLQGFSVAKYASMNLAARELLLRERLPAKLCALKDCFRNVIFIEPEPDAGGAGEVFDACAGQLSEFRYSVWRFRPPFDRLFRLSPTQSTTQAVYAYTRDPALLDPISAYADPL